MRIISSQDGCLRVLAAASLRRRLTEGFITKLPALDALAPGQVFARGAVHELLREESVPSPYLLAALLARGASREGSGVVVWVDPEGTLYPPALAAMGMDLCRLLIVRPQRPRDLAWALVECLRCPGVDAVVAEPGSLSPIEARRLQLSAEGGGGVGILLRTWRPHRTAYAAATRWRVHPVPGEPRVQRWKVQLLHGHGGQVGHHVYLEFNRETNHVRALARLVDRATGAPRRATA